MTPAIDDHSTGGHTTAAALADRARRHVEALRDVAERLASASEVADVLDRVARTTAEALGAEAAAILIRHDHEHVLVSAFGSLQYRRGAKDADLPTRLGDGWDAIASAPMHDGGETIGLVWMGRTCGAFPPDTVALLRALADVTALGISKLRAHEQLRRARSRGDGTPGDVAPCERPSTTACPAPAAATPGDPHCVLIVDDSERVLLQARLALQDTMTVLTATSGPAAIAKYRTARPALVVIDLDMPSMNGFETLAELQTHGCTSALALTLRGDALQPARARKAGYLGIVEKPFREGELAAAVGSALASAEALDPDYMSEDDGYAFLTLPGTSPRGLTKLLPAIERNLRMLAEQCTDSLIVDVRAVTQVNAEHVTVLARVRSEAQTRGIHTVICAGDPTVAKLRQIVELRDATYVADPEQAKRSLRSVRAAG
jgi:CheY-like chemotaxis protein